MGRLNTKEQIMKLPQGEVRGNTRWPPAISVTESIVPLTERPTGQGFYVHDRCDDNIASRSGQGRVLEASDGHIVVDTFAQVDTSGDGYSGVGYTCLGIKCWL